MSSRRLGATVKRVRLARALTQAALAAKAGIHPIYLAHIEGGTKIPSIPTLEKIAKALKVPAGDLLR